jgi:hypothetical protein
MDPRLPAGLIAIRVGTPTSIFTIIRLRLDWWSGLMNGHLAVPGGFDETGRMPVVLFFQKY